MKLNLKPVVNNIKLKLPKKGSFIFNVLTLMTGASIAQVIPVVISPILTRVYTPENFGIFALFLSITGILSVIVTGRYGLAIMLPEKDEESVNLLILSILIACGISLIVLIIVFIFNNQITKLLSTREISRWLYFIPFAILLAGIYQALNCWSIRKKQFKSVSFSKVGQSTTRAATSLSLGLLKFGSTGLIIANFVGQTIATLILGWQVWKNDKNKMKFVLKEKIKKVAKKYKNFPKYSTWSALLNTASVQVPILILTPFFGSEVVGFYSLSHRVLTMPISLLGQAVGQTFFQKASENKNNRKRLQYITFEVYKKLLYVGCFPILVITFFGKEIFSFIFGAQWIIAGNYAQILSIWILLVFISSPLSTLFIVLNKLRQGLMVDIILFSSRVISLLVGVMFFKNIEISIILFGTVSAIIWLGLCLYILKLVSIPYLTSFFVMLKVILISSLPLIILRFTIGNI